MRDILLALFIFGTIPFIFTRPYLGILVWSWLGFMNPHRLTWGFAYSFPWVQLIAIVTMISFALSAKEKFHIPWTGVTSCFFLLVALTGVTSIFAFVPHAAFVQFQVFAKIMIMVLFTLILVQTRERLHWLVWVIAVSIGFYGFKGGIFTILHGGHNQVMGPPQSFLTDRNALALAFCMTIPLMRYLQLQSEKRWVRLGLWAGMGLTSLSVLGTYSRGGMLTLVAVLIFVFMKSRKKLVLLALGVIALPVALALLPQAWFQRMDTIQTYQKNESAVGRIQSWKFATRVALARPLVGGGFRLYQDRSAWNKYAPTGAVRRAVHSIFFDILGEQGFIGLGLFLMILFLSWRNNAWVRKRTRERPEFSWAYDLASMLQATMVAYVIGGALLPLPYFDLAYQLFAIMMLLRVNVEKELRAREAARIPERQHAYGGVPA